MPGKHTYVSPLYAPQNDFTTVSASCSAHTLDILRNMYTLTQAILNKSHITGPQEISTHMEKVYPCLVNKYLTQDDLTPDWIHESIRLAALIYTHSTLNPNHPTNTAHKTPSTDTTTLLPALQDALQKTTLTNCWGPLRGVFLWVCLIGATACEAPPNSPRAQIPIATMWARKCFSLWAIRAVESVGFEHADTMMRTLENALRVRSSRRA